jgi:hypothetical protein
MRTGRTMAVLATAAAVIVTGTACGGSPAAPSAGSSGGTSVAAGDDYAVTGFTKDPRALLTDAEVTAALGGKAIAQPGTSATG